ncbi:hypothetical protein DYBT9275_05478 [Dyadobacter sp. CECT 9275]|uniref:Uncharacterized protein n=1 Tax=Dyadobacter helix TaxID=2822344 RepID=A0A916NEF4_9BACT|nr:hypothetical protein [Dyadobacter sp. CECT 9275]CAG5016108.1 hypothetical protein DYBT9275_05478 [Dyadobacter sp. CECT 9275]
MKIIVFILLIVGHCSYGQMKVTDTLITPNGVKYIVSKNLNDVHSPKFYSNSRNRLDYSLPKVPPEVSHYGSTYIDNGVEERKRRDLLLLRAFQGASRPIPTDTLYMTFKMKASGDILEMNFHLTANSKLSVDDIELVEKTLKQNFKLKIDSEKYKRMEYYWFSCPLYFAELKKLSQ